MKRTAAQKARAVAHHHKHVKPAHAHAKAAATGHAHKHHKAAKHHAKPHKHKGTVARGLATGAEVASCAAEALAASLRLPGLSVSSADVLALHRAAGADDETGVPVLALLEAASEHGLAGVRPVSYSPVIEFLDSGYRPDAPMLARTELAAGDVAGERLASARPVSLILGVELPGAHAVLATPEGWWSWGELWCPVCDFPDAVAEEAWLVRWS